MVFAVRAVVLAVTTACVLTLTLELTADHVCTAGEVPSQETDNATHVTVAKTWIH